MEEEKGRKGWKWWGWEAVFVSPTYGNQIKQRKINLHKSLKVRFGVGGERCVCVSDLSPRGVGIRKGRRGGGKREGKSISSSPPSSLLFSTVTLQSTSPQVTHSTLTLLQFDSYQLPHHTILLFHASANPNPAHASPTPQSSYHRAPNLKNPPPASCSFFLLFLFSHFLR